MAKQVLAAVGQPDASMDVVFNRVRANLAYLERQQKAVVKIGDRKTTKWRLAKLPGE